MLLTIREASRLIGRTPATVRRYIRSGRLRAEKEPGKFGEEYKIRREDLLSLGFTADGELPVHVVEERNIEITLLQEKVKRLEAAAAHAAADEGLDKNMAEIRQKERDIAKIEAEEPGVAPRFDSASDWLQRLSTGTTDSDQDH